MEAILLKLVEQLNSSVFVLLGILACAFITIYKVGRWSEKFKNHDDKIIKIDGLSEKVLLIQQKVDLIYDNTLGVRRPVAAMSPITLTDSGKEIVENIQAESILNRCITQLENDSELQNANNAYDIQMSAMKIAKTKMQTCLNESEFIKVKSEAFNRGLLVEDIMSVFGVLLRNRVLEKKGIPISEVDKHAPGKSK